MIATGTSVAPHAGFQTGRAAAVGSLASKPAVQSSWYARLRRPRYPTWSTFAAALSTHIWLLNRRRNRA